MSKIRVEEENTQGALEEAAVLGEAHYNEVEAKASSVPFSLDVTSLFPLLDAGMMSVVTARDGEKLVGYFINLITPDLFTSKLLSKEVGIYLDPSYRGGTCFPRMMSLAEDIAKERGAYSQLLCFKEGHDFGIAQRLGYEKTETVYQKLLEE